MPYQAFEAAGVKQHFPEIKSMATCKTIFSSTPTPITGSFILALSCSGLCIPSHAACESLNILISKIRTLSIEKETEAFQAKRHHSTN